MSISIAIYSFLSLFYVGLGINIFNLNRNSRSNQMFLVITSTLSIWSLLLALMSVSQDPEVAAFYRWLMTIAWSALYAQILIFVIEIIGFREKLHPIWYRVAIYSPALFCFFYYILNPIPAEYMVRLSGTWAYQFPIERGFFYNHYFTIYYVTYLLTSIIMLFRQSLNAKYTRKRKRAQVIFISLIITGILASIPDVILPNYGFTRIPPTTVVLSAISIIAIWYSIRQYSFMNLSSQKLLHEVSKIMNEGIIILNNKDEVLNLNRGAQELLGLDLT